MNCLNLLKFSNKKIILEEYLKGQQLSTESIISNYNVKTVGISDRNYEFLKRFEPNIMKMEVIYHQNI